MMSILFGLSETAICRRYEKDGIIIELHIFENPAGGMFCCKEFSRGGINHISLLVENKKKFLQKYDFDAKIYNNPKGHQNVFIRDFEGNWIELYENIPNV
jgi:hypothetical protein